MPTTYFTLQEAKSKLNRRVITTTPFYQLQCRSFGRVVDFYEMGNLRYGLIIVWDGTVISDGFSRNEYEEFLREV